jgi:hypothetical protein
LREPNLGKTNPRVTLFICLRFVLCPLSRTRFFITNANPACSCVYICKFQFRPIHPPSRRLSEVLCMINSFGRKVHTRGCVIKWNVELGSFSFNLLMISLNNVVKWLFSQSMTACFFNKRLC